jgi:hypothetical protein
MDKIEIFILFSVIFCSFSKKFQNISKCSILWREIIDASIPENESILSILRYSRSRSWQL